MAISTRWPASPVTRPTHSPSIVARPSSSRPSSRKKSIVSPRSSTTIPTLSIRLSAMCRLYKMSPGCNNGTLRDCFVLKTSKRQHKNFRLPGSFCFGSAIQVRKHCCYHEGRRHGTVVSIYGVPLCCGFAAMLRCLRSQQWHGLSSVSEDNHVPGRLRRRECTLCKRDGHRIPGKL